MNNVLKAIVFSISAYLAATSAFAAPHQEPAHQNAQHNTHAQAQKAPAKHQAQQHKKAVKPSHDWRAGQQLPSQYRGAGYKVDHSKFKKLSKPGKNQQWIKVNGDYVLINTMNHHIVKVIAG